jgi:anti-anti-sigma factor
MTAVAPGTQPQSLTGHIVAHREGNAGVLRLVGEIDDFAVDAFCQSPLNTSVDPRTDHAIQVIDLSEVTYLSSSGVGLLLRLTRSVRDRGELPELRGLSRPAQRILAHTGAISLFRPST